VGALFIKIYGGPNPTDPAQKSKRDKIVLYLPFIHVCLPCHTIILYLFLQFSEKVGLYFTVSQYYSDKWQKSELKVSFLKAVGTSISG